MTQAVYDQRENPQGTTQRALLALYHGCISPKYIPGDFGHSDLLPIWAALKDFAPQHMWRYDDHDSHSYLLQAGWSLERRLGVVKDFAAANFNEKAIDGALRIAKFGEQGKYAMRTYLGRCGNGLTAEAQAAVDAGLAIDKDEFWMMSDDPKCAPQLELTDAGKVIARVMQ